MEPADRLFILAFDHRGSFQSKWFGIGGEPTDEETLRIADGKELIFQGLELALSRGAHAGTSGGLVDEQFGAPKRIPDRIKKAGMKLAMPVEKSGQAEFDFEYGEEFGDHIERFNPDFVKVLVRYNPDGDPEVNRRQATRLVALSAWLRPRLMVGAIAELQDAGVEPAVWKIEGLERRDDCERVVAQCRTGGRDQVVCVVLGRGAERSRVERWLASGAGVDGYVGFAIGRSIWGDPLTGFLEGDLSRDQATEQVADTFAHFVEVYEGATSSGS